MKPIVHQFTHEDDNGILRTGCELQDMGVTSF